MSLSRQAKIIDGAEAKAIRVAIKRKLPSFPVVLN